MILIHFTDWSIEGETYCRLLVSSPLDKFKSQLCKILDAVLFPIFMDDEGYIIVDPKDLEYQAVERCLIKQHHLLHRAFSKNFYAGFSMPYYLQWLWMRTTPSLWFRKTSCMKSFERLDSRVAFEVQQCRIVDAVLPYIRYEIAQWSVHGSITKNDEESLA